MAWEVGSSMRGMARLKRIVAGGWAGGEWTRAGWVDMLFSARSTASDLFSSFRGCGLFLSKGLRQNQRNIINDD